MCGERRVGQLPNGAASRLRALRMCTLRVHLVHDSIGHRVAAVRQYDSIRPLVQLPVTEIRPSVGEDPYLTRHC